MNKNMADDKADIQGGPKNVTCYPLQDILHSLLLLW